MGVASDIDVAVIGASGWLGRRVVGRLAGPGLTVAAVGRSPEKLASFAPSVVRRIADCEDPRQLAAALTGARRVVSCVHARFAPAILTALPPRTERLVLVGSTRRFTRFTDRPAKEVRAAEELLERSGRSGVILHPTMIYGPAGENNVRRIAALIRRFGVILLPRGGSCLVQPVHVEDVAASVVAALRDGVPGLTPAIVIAGPQPITMANFVQAIADAMGKRVLLLSAPAWVLCISARLMRLVPGMPRIDDHEIRRLLEDKSFSIEHMRHRLQVNPRPLSDGLAEMFAQGADD
jgi:nucleoside-diphosphate-sugar epimerase